MLDESVKGQIISYVDMKGEPHYPIAQIFANGEVRQA